jgi:FkbM family methyltransferase
LNLSQANGGGEEITIFDVGANTGQSIKFFKSLYPNAKIYAFEPSPKTFSLLEKFTNRFDTRGISIFQVGMGDVERTIDFYESTLNETSTYSLPNQTSKYLRTKNRILFQKSGNAFKRIQTQITTLDVFTKYNQVRNIDILKIDVEGFEFEVLRGASRTLIECGINIIQFERHLDDMRDDNFPDIDEYLKNHGYSRIHQIKHPFGYFFEMLYQKSKK